MFFSALGGDGENKGFVDSLKSGVANVLLIAGGILAIGTAFMLIGNVNFVSVIALGLTLPLIAIAFSKISEMEGIRDLGAMKTICIFITNVWYNSSNIIYFKWGLALFHCQKIATAAAISGVLYVMGHGIVKVNEAIHGKDLKSMFLVPAVMVVSSVAIALSSEILKFVTPVAIPQLLTAVGIAGIFAILGMGIGKAAESVGKMNILGVMLLPMVMVTSSVAIALSSHILRTVAPIAIPQLLTALAVSLVYFMFYHIL